MTKKAKNKNKLFTQHYRLLSAIIIIAVTAIGGAFYLLYVRADYYNGGRGDWRAGDVYIDWGSTSTTVGETVSRTIYGHVPSASALRSSSDGMHLSLWAHTYDTANYINPPGYTCGPGLSCVASARENVRNWPTDFVACIDVPASQYGNVALRLMTIPYRLNAPTASHGLPQVQIGWEWNAGTCFAPRGYSIYMYNADWVAGGVSNSASGGILGDDRSSGLAPGNTSGGTGSGTDGAGNGSGGTGTGTKGTGTGGGSSSGSISTSQSQQPNTVPSSSAQGQQNQQASVQPSPFYDGKQYEAGSDGDSQETSILASAGHQAVKSWPLVTVLLGLVVVGGGLYWRFWHKRKS